MSDFAGPDMRRSAIFVDRDGVLIENCPNYVRHPSHIEVFPQALEACQLITASEYALVVVSNQSAVGRGILTLEQVNALNEKVVALFERAGVKVDASYICPHKPEDGCDCRKPKPGMLLRAARDFDLDLEHSFLVGDNMTDIEAAVAAGVKGILVKTGMGTEQLKSLHPYDGPVAEDLLHAVRTILHQRTA